MAAKRVKDEIRCAVLQLYLCGVLSPIAVLTAGVPSPAAAQRSKPRHLSISVWLIRATLHSTLLCTYIPISPVAARKEEQKAELFGAQWFSRR